MPFFRFHIDAMVGSATALERVKAITRATPGWWTGIKEALGTEASADRPFLGKIDGSSFRIQRHIRYRNSFLPQIRGSVADSAAGSRVTVTMYLHPFVAIFVLAWLTGVGMAAIAGLARATLVPVGMFVFGVALTLAGFFPEALRARKLLQQAIAGDSGERGTSWGDRSRVIRQ